MLFSVWSEILFLAWSLILWSNFIVNWMHARGIIQSRWEINHITCKSVTRIIKLKKVDYQSSLQANNLEHSSPSPKFKLYNMVHGCMWVRMKVHPCRVGCSLQIWQLSTFQVLHEVSTAGITSGSFFSLHKFVINSCTFSVMGVLTLGGSTRPCRIHEGRPSHRASRFWFTLDSDELQSSMTLKKSGLGRVGSFWLGCWLLAKLLGLGWFEHSFSIGWPHNCGISSHTRRDRSFSGRSKLQRKPRSWSGLGCCASALFCP